MTISDLTEEILNFSEQIYAAPRFIVGIPFRAVIPIHICAERSPVEDADISYQVFYTVYENLYV